MAYPNSFLRLVVSGTLYTVETFSWSLTLIRNFQTGLVAPTTVPAGILTAVQNLVTGGGLGNPAKTTMVKLNEIGPNGRYVRPTTVLHEVTPAWSGGASTNLPVAQVALAVSLMTSVKRGLASSGRFYLPVPALALGGDGRLTAASADVMAQNCTAFLNAVNAAAGGWRVGIVSPGGVGSSTGAERPVTQVRVGRALDTIRSRRTKIPEDYVSGTVLTGG